MSGRWKWFFYPCLALSICCGGPFLFLLWIGRSIPGEDDFARVKLGMDAVAFAQAYPFRTTAFFDLARQPDAARFVREHPQRADRFSGELCIFRRTGADSPENVFIFVEGRLNVERSKKEGTVVGYYFELTPESPIQEGRTLRQIVKALEGKDRLCLFFSPDSWAADLSLPRDAKKLAGFSGELSDNLGDVYHIFKWKDGKIFAKDTFPCVTCD